jgi:hypothetical protein
MGVKRPGTAEMNEEGGGGRGERRGEEEGEGEEEWEERPCIPSLLSSSTSAAELQAAAQGMPV